MQQQPEHVSPEAAYAAALNRAVRTTEALVLAEAQVIELRRELHAMAARVEEERERTEAALQRTEAALQRYRNARDTAGRYRRRLRQELEDQEEGEGHGSEADAAEAVREAVPAHDFSD
jgi:hypothetical protein